MAVFTYRKEKMAILATQSSDLSGSEKIVASPFVQIVLFVWPK